MDQTTTLPPTGLWRRLAAIVYDTFLLFAVLALATFMLLPFTGGEAIAAGNPWFFPYLLAVSFAFLGGFWSHGGQTLGMLAWRLRVQTFDGQPLSWKQALIRFAAALLSWLPAGAGFLWQWLDHDRLAWHDRLSGTYLAVIPK